MKLLLCSSAPWQNTRLENTFLDILSKPIKENTLFILSLDTTSQLWQEQLEFTKQWYQRIGFHENNIAVYNLQTGTIPHLRGLDVLHVVGGNPFHYMKRIRETGLVPKIREFVERNGVYIGSSAGSVIMGPDIDKNFTAAVNDVGLDDVSGFGYVDFYIIVHWDTKDGDLLTSFITYSWKTGKRIIALTDQQAILVLNKGFKVI
jgi:dipeptidase E